MQGKFWEMLRTLYANQFALEKGSLFQYAQTVGLDMARFKAAIDGRIHKEKVQADKNKGRQVGVESTPAVFVNGRRFGLPRAVDSFEFRLGIEDERGICK